MDFNCLQSKKTLLIHLLKLLLACAPLALLSYYFVDQTAALFFDLPEVMPYRAFAREITNIGLSQHYFMLSAGVYIFCRWLAPRMERFNGQQNRLQYYRAWSINLFVALITSGLIVHILKVLVGRQRPHKSAPLFDPTVFSPISWHWHWHSFPSGHSQTMFAVATLMTVILPKQKWLWIVFATVICMTRAVIHDHFISDTIMGAYFGYAGALWALFLLQKKYPCVNQN